MAKISWLAIVVFLCGLVGGAVLAKETTVDKATRDKVLLLGNGSEPQGLDPHLVTGVPEHYLLASIFEGLVGEDPKTLEPVPGAAKSWTISEDLKTYTFKLQDNGRWSNGDPVTAQDFVYSWQRALSPKLGSEYAYMLYYVSGGEDYHKGKTTDFSKVGVKAVDDKTLVVTLANPTSFFLRLLQHYSSWPVHKPTIEKFGKIDSRETRWTQPGNLVGNGPFVLKEWAMNKVIRVEKNPHYWDAKTVQLNGIHFFPIDSRQVEERNFRTGQLHATYPGHVPLNKIAVYQAKNPELIRISPYLGTYFYRFNMTRKPLDNPLVRKALSMSIDRNAIVKQVAKGGQSPAYCFTPPDTAGYFCQAKIEYSIEKAKQLLSEAGYPGGKGFPTLEILYNTDEAHRAIAEAIQQMWKKNLNIEVQLVNQEWKVYINNQQHLQYFISRAGWIGDYPDPNSFLDMFVTGGGNNNTGWSNKTYDDLIRLAGQTVDPKARYEVFQKAEKILMDESPVMPIYTYTNPSLISPHLKGWYSNILEHHPYKHVYLSVGSNTLEARR